MPPYRPRFGSRPGPPEANVAPKSAGLDVNTPMQDRIPTRPQRSSVQPSPVSTADYLRADDLLRIRLLAQALNVPLFNLPEKFGVRSAASRWNRAPDEGVPYLLGKGVSCTVVQHETDNSTAKVVSPGTIVALKRYIQDNPVDDAATDKRLAEVILQDLRVLCHPQLRSHENFCRLLYIAWEPYSLVPALALELASFGTLHDALASEFKPSWLQKCHIGLDIALGLHHLHDCGIVHGDIKSRNVMLQEHKDRHVVAKLMDFSGATDTVHYGTATHSQFMSRMWLSPEILLGQSNIDYKKADTYAFGMLLTQIFCDIDFDVCETYVETLVPQFFTDTEKQALTLYYKCCSTTDANSLLHQSRKLIATSDDYLQSKVASFPLDIVQEGTLVPDPNERLDFEQILQHFAQFALNLGRTIPACLDTTQVLLEEQEFWKDASGWNFFLTCQVFNDLFAQASERHQKVVLEYMIKAAGRPESAEDLLVHGTEADYQNKDRLLDLLWRNERAEKALSPEQKHKSHQYYQIAMCYLMGLGTRINEDEALKYLAMAAKNFARRAMFMYSSVEASTNAAPIPHVPHRLLLSIAYLNDCTESVDHLRAQYPNLLTILKAIRSEKGLPLHRTICLDTAATLWTDSAATHNGAHDIFELIQSEDLDSVQQLLAANPTFASEITNGLSPLHALSLISDDVASQMAIVLLAAGASLDAVAYEPMQASKNRLTIGRATPLSWAISKKKPRLFKSLIKWCVENNILPNVGRRILGGLPIYYRQPEMAQYLAEAQRKMVQSDESRAKWFFWSLGTEDIPEVYLSDFDFAGPEMEVAQFMQILSWKDILHQQLYQALERNDGDTILRRWMLGNNYQSFRAQIAALVAPWSIKPGNSPYIDEEIALEAVRIGDGIYLMALINALKRNGYSIDQAFGPLGMMKGPLQHSVLHGTLLTCNMEAFNMLLPQFRHFIEAPSAGGITPLIYAAAGGNIDAVRTLLKHDANILHRQKNGANAIVLALAYNHEAIADLLLTNCDASAGLGPSPRGVTAFEQVLNTYLFGRRHIKISTFDFLRRHNALNFILGGDDNVWRRMFTRSCASLDEHLAADLRLLRYFLRDDVFGTRINELDHTGRTALHYAAYYNHFEALKMMLGHKASVNIECAPVHEDPEKIRGKTAVDFALKARKLGAPDHVLVGGAQEIRTWETRLEAILRLLVGQGAKSGNGSNAYNFLEIGGIKEPEIYRSVYVHDWKNPTRGELTWRGKWPKPIPRCPSTTPHAISGPIPQQYSEPDEPGQSDKPMQTSQLEPIVYRAPGGRKTRVLPFTLSLLGSLLNGPVSPTSSEDQQRFRELLAKAETFNAAKRREQHDDVQPIPCPRPTTIFAQTIMGQAALKS